MCRALQCTAEVGHVLWKQKASKIILEESEGRMEESCGDEQAPSHMGAGEAQEEVGKASPGSSRGLGGAVELHFCGIQRARASLRHGLKVELAAS